MPNAFGIVYRFAWVLFTMEASAQSYHLAGHRAAAKHRDEEYVVAGHFARG